MIDDKLKVEQEREEDWKKKEIKLEKAAKFETAGCGNEQEINSTHAEL